jgi:hypothetical protein
LNPNLPFSTPQPTATALPADWEPVGCMIDDPNYRTLPNGPNWNRKNNTISSCVAFCASQDYPYAGVEYGAECWCSNQIVLDTAPVAECNVPCAGDQFAQCGGSYRINVFMNTFDSGSNGTRPLPTVTGTRPAFNTAQPTSTVAPTAFPTASLAKGWKDLGCTVDDPDDRALNRGTITLANITIPGCLAACEMQGFEYAGVEYGQECW